MKPRNWRKRYDCPLTTDRELHTLPDCEIARQEKAYREWLVSSGRPSGSRLRAGIETGYPNSAMCISAHKRDVPPLIYRSSSCGSLVCTVAAVNRLTLSTAAACSFLPHPTAR